MFELQSATHSALTQLIAAQSHIVSGWLRDTNSPRPPLFVEADAARLRHYGRSVFLRGLIEYSNICSKGCLYCGLRAPNGHIKRYRLSDESMLTCVRHGHALGFRSFVLQGGEDAHFNAGHMAHIVSQIKSEFPDIALTLSCGELPDGMYEKLRTAGADRYLLRHETAHAGHYAKLHPANMHLESRVRCLQTLKRLGYKIGAGFMVGSPFQTHEMLAGDLLFLRDLAPNMVGIGPFLPQSDTPFAKASAGSLALTLTMLALTRILLPCATIPATTALGTLADGGRELGLIAGANVIMPNLTPTDFRANYLLYDGKIGIDSAVDDGLRRIVRSVENSGFVPDFSRGDPL